MEAWRRGRGRRLRGAAGAARRRRSDAAELDAIRARDVHRRGGRTSASASPTTTWPRSSTCSAASAGAGRALDPLRPDLLGRARHRAGAAAARRRRGRSSPARASSSRRSPRARASTPTRCCVGRTHGVHAEPTTFGIKLAGFAFEAHRNAERLRARVRAGRGRRALRRRRHLRRDRARTSRRACSPASGSRASRLDPGRRRATATPSCCSAIALAGAGLERLATEVRHLQRTEVREVQEPFRAGQKGSSAMPHKRNPIKSRADHRARARAARQRAGGARERRAVARARHLALRRSSA